MTHGHPFHLIPFPSASHGGAPQASLEGLSITGTLAIAGADVQIDYRIAGDLSKLTIPAASADPQRRDGLWQSTCLELFLAAEGAREYWEFNLSPAGHWNVYQLDDYRQGLKTEAAYQQLPFAVDWADQQLSLSLRCSLPPGLQARSSPGLEANVTAVIEHTDGHIDYWALHHPAPDADFHHRGGFQIKL
jgi:hypothetical protein